MTRTRGSGGGKELLLQQQQQMTATGRPRREKAMKRHEDEYEDDDLDDDEEDDEGEEDEDDSEEEDDEDDEPVRKSRKKGKGNRQGSGSGSTTSGSSGGGRKGSGKKSSKSRRELPTGAVAILKQWLLSAEHFTHPYPTAQDQQHLMAVTGIDKKQLKNWFTNARRRIWKPMMKKQMEAHKVAMPLGVGGAHHGMAPAPFGNAAFAIGQPGQAQQQGHGGQQQGMGTQSGQPAHGMGLSFTSFDDLFKTFMPQDGAGGASQGNNGQGMPQPGMHPLMKTFSSKSFSNLRTASLTDFPRTDSYAFLEVFFNDEGLQDGLTGEQMDNIGLSMDDPGAGEGSPNEPGIGGMKRVISQPGTEEAGPAGKRFAASNSHISFAHPASVQIHDMHMQQQPAQQQVQLQHVIAQAQQQHQQQPGPSLTITAPAYYNNGNNNNGNNSGFQQRLSPRMRGNQGAGGLQRSGSTTFPQQQHDPQQHLRAGSPAPPHLPQQQQQPPGSTQPAVHVSSAARCPFCPELNVDTQLRPCGHLFHGSCLKPWLQEAQGIPGCPVCHVPISSCVLAVPCINNNATGAHGHQPGDMGGLKQETGPFF